jgi:hypothetical protein
MFKQTIDARYASAQPATPTTGSNALPMNNMHQNPVQQTPSKIPSSAFISKSYFLQCKQIVENHAIIVTVEDSSDEECNYPLDVNATTCSRTKASSSIAPEIDTKADTRNSLSVQPATAEPKILTVEPKKPPAFTYESKAAMPEAVQCVF